MASCLVMARPAYADDTPRFAAGGALMVSPVGSLHFTSDDHGPEDRVTQALGLEGETLLSVIPYLRVGVGGRYSLTQINEFGPRELGHILSVPLLVVGSLGFESGSALELRFGLGYGVALYPDQSHGTVSGAPLRAYGRTTEILLGYVHPLSPRLLATTHLGLQMAKLRTVNGESYWEDAYGENYAIALTFGVRSR